MQKIRDIKKVSYERELELGKRLVARRAVEDRLEAEDRLPTAEEAETVLAGDAAAEELVIAYTPYLMSLANRVANENRMRVGDLRQADDYLSRGVVQALLRARSFNPQGRTMADGSTRPGVRFATYIERDVLKAMRREAIEASSVVSIDPLRVTNTSKWVAAKAAFVDEHERQPTDEEMEEITGVRASQIYTGHYLKSSAPQIEEWTTSSDTSDLTLAPVSPLIEYESDNAGYIFTLLLALGEALEPTDMHMALEVYGVLDGNPKDPSYLYEAFPEMFNGQAATRRWFKSVSSKLTHPQGKARMIEKIEEVQAIAKRRSGSIEDLRLGAD